jgi:DASH complex subunit DAD2
MASSKHLFKAICNSELTEWVVKIPKPKDRDENKAEETKDESEVPLPQTLVRIPTEHAPILQQAGASEGVGGE